MPFQNCVRYNCKQFYDCYSGNLILPILLWLLLWLLLLLLAVCFFLFVFLTFSSSSGSSFRQSCLQYNKDFYTRKLGSSSWNYFGVNLLTLSCKLDHLINISNIYILSIKRCSLQIRVSKFMPKSFMRFTLGPELFTK
jgi:hypothetical protein